MSMHFFFSSQESAYSEHEITNVNQLQNSLEAAQFRASNKLASEYVVSELKEVEDDEEKDDKISKILAELYKKKSKKN